VVRELLRRAGGLDVFGIEVDYVARREDRCGRAMAVVVSRHIVLGLGQRRLGFFKGVLHPVRKLVNRFDVGWRLMRFKAHPRVSAGIEEEGCLLRGGMDVDVVGKLRQREECVPVVLSLPDEETQVLFQFLVDPFRLSVGLRVVGGRRRGFDSQQSVQFLHEGSNELWPAVGNNLLREAVKFPNVPKVEVCCPGSGDHGDCFNEVRTFTYRVDGHHDGVVSAQFWEFRDEVHADDIPAFFWDWEQLEFSAW